jgi:hypothetical protein
MAGYLYEAPRRIGYRPTRRIVDVAERSRQTIHCWFDSPRGLMRCDESGETVVLAKLQRVRVLHRDVRESNQTIRYGARAGDYSGAARTFARQGLLEQWRGRLAGTCFEAIDSQHIRRLRSFRAKRSSATWSGRSMADATHIQASAWRISLVSDVQSKRRVVGTRCPSRVPTIAWSHCQASMRRG